MDKTNASSPQPHPQPGKVRVLDVVINDLNERAESGRVKYGTYLESHNGRDPLWDAYQEAVDLVMYLRQALLEREGDKTPSSAPNKWLVWARNIEIGMNNLWTSAGSTIQTRTRNAVIQSAKHIAAYYSGVEEPWVRTACIRSLPCFTIGDSSIVGSFDKWAAAVLSGEIVLRNAHGIGLVGEADLMRQLRQDYGHYDNHVVGKAVYRADDGSLVTKDGDVVAGGEA